MKRINLSCFFCLIVITVANSQGYDLYNAQPLLPQKWYKLDKTIPANPMFRNGRFVVDRDDIYTQYLSLAYLLNYHPKVDNWESKTCNADADVSSFDPFITKKSDERVIFFNPVFNDNINYLFPVLKNKFLIDSLSLNEVDFTNIRMYLKANNTKKGFYWCSIRFQLSPMTFRISGFANENGNLLRATEYDKVKKIFDNELSMMLKKIIFFLKDTATMTAYKQEFADLYGKNWDKTIEERRIKYELVMADYAKVEKEQQEIKKNQEIARAAEREQSKKMLQNLQEGDRICAKDINCSKFNQDDCLVVGAFIEKWNSNRTKYQIRIHTVNSGGITYKDASGAVYVEVDGIRYYKGEVIWIDPFERPNTLWITCQLK